jgi:serralysin
MIDGGPGTDTVVYSGMVSQYQVTQNPNGSFHIFDLRPNALDGTDDVSNVEFLQFADLTVNPRNLFPTVIEANGSTSLTEVGNHFFLFDSIFGSGPSLKSGGADYVEGQFGPWAPIGAEKTASGYEVAWKNGSADQYSVWNTDGSGNYTSSAISVVSGADYALQSLEPSFHQDLNGDGHWLL